MLLEAMKSPRCAVMIARGDLAVECGFERMAEVQEEILWLCEAGHVPVIWATQVLETLAKEGMPSRAEVTDAAMAHRAECVMLNKGPYIVQAVQGARRHPAAGCTGTRRRSGRCCASSSSCRHSGTCEVPTGPQSQADVPRRWPGRTSGMIAS